MPATIIGLILAVLAFRGGRVRAVDGVLEAYGPVLRWGLSHLIPIPGGAVAITLGHVVLGANASALWYSRDHERVHVTQYEQWGPLFLPAYCVASLWAVARGGHFYFDNCFERAARETEARMADSALGDSPCHRGTVPVLGDSPRLRM